MDSCFFESFFELVEEVLGGRYLVVGAGVADEFVVSEEGKCLLGLRRFDPAAEVFECMLAVDTGFAGGFINAFLGVLILDAEEPLDATESAFGVGGDDGVCPVQGVGAHADDFLSEVMDGFSDTAAASTYPENMAVFAFFEPSVAGDFFHFIVEGADHDAVPAHPYLFANVLGGDFVVGAFDFDVAVAVDLAGSFFKARKEADG